MEWRMSDRVLGCGTTYRNLTVVRNLNLPNQAQDVKPKGGTSLPSSAAGERKESEIVLWESHGETACMIVERLLAFCYLQLPVVVAHLSIVGTLFTAIQFVAIPIVLFLLHFLLLFLRFLLLL